MATIVKITVTMEVACNLGNYQNVKLGGAVEATVGPTDETELVYSGLCGVLKQGIIDELSAMKEPAADRFIALIENEDEDLAPDDPEAPAF